MSNLWIYDDERLKQKKVLFSGPVCFIPGPRFSVRLQALLRS